MHAAFVRSRAARHEFFVCGGERPRGKAHDFVERIGSVVAAVSTDYTRYVNQSCVHLETTGGFVKPEDAFGRIDAKAYSGNPGAVNPCLARMRCPAADRMNMAKRYAPGEASAITVMP